MFEKFILSYMGLNGYYVKSIKLEENKFHMYVEKEKKEFICSRCGRLTFSIHSQWEYTLTERPMLGYPVFIHLKQYRIRCVCSDSPVKDKSPDIQEPGFRVTAELGNMISKMAEDIPIKNVSLLVGIHWNTARDIDYERLKRKIEKIDYVAPNCIGVDEVAYSKGHKYFTIVTDQDSKKIIYVTKGRKTENLEKFFEERIDPLASKSLEAASIDMWDPYEKAIRKHAKNAIVVYDKFHIFRKLNECVDEVRRKEKSILESQGKKLLKHDRFLLLKGQENLTAKEQQSLEEILKQNEPLNKAYLLKEEFRRLYEIEISSGEKPHETYQKAFQVMVGWLKKVSESKLSSYEKFAKMVKKRWSGMLNYYIYPISNGLSESLNNKIASLRKRAYGYRNMEYFTLKIYQQGNFI